MLTNAAVNMSDSFAFKFEWPDGTIEYNTKQGVDAWRGWRVVPDP